MKRPRESRVRYHRRVPFTLRGGLREHSLRQAQTGPGREPKAPSCAPFACAEAELRQEGGAWFELSPFRFVDVDHALLREVLHQLHRPGPGAAGSHVLAQDLVHLLLGVHVLRQQLLVIGAVAASRLQCEPSAEFGPIGPMI